MAYVRIVDEEICDLLENMNAVYREYLEVGNNYNCDFAEFSRQSRDQLREVLNNPAVKSESISSIIRKNACARRKGHLPWSAIAASEIANAYYIRQSA